MVYLREVPCTSALFGLVIHHDPCSFGIALKSD